MDLLERYKEKDLGVAEEKVYVSSFDGAEVSGGFVVHTLVKISGGLIQTERQANITLGVLVIIFFALSLYFTFGQSSASPVSTKSVQSPKNRGL